MAKIASIGDGWYARGEKLTHQSRRSLLDFEIILFVTPGISGEVKQHHENMNHWRKEIAEALNHGKTVFVICRDPTQYSTPNGARASGQQFIPVPVTLLSRQGSEVISGPQSGEIADIFGPFVPYVSYDVNLDGQLDAKFLLTKTGGYVVAGRKGHESGNLVFLPNFDLKKLYAEHKGPAREPAVQQLGTEFEEFLRSYHGRLSKDGKSSPPTWLHLADWRPK